MAARFWLHVNHPNNYTRIHIEDGCKRSRDAIAGKLAGKPYGPILGDRNGWWEGPFSSRAEVEAAQSRAKKATNGDCSFCFGG
jgi:hypothetical protein